MRKRKRSKKTQRFLLLPRAGSFTGSISHSVAIFPRPSTFFSRLLSSINAPALPYCISLVYRTRECNIYMDLGRRCRLSIVFTCFLRPYLLSFSSVRRRTSGCVQHLPYFSFSFFLIPPTHTHTSLSLSLSLSLFFPAPFS